MAILQWLDASDDYSYLQYMGLEDRREFLEASCMTLSSHPSIVYLYNNSNILSKEMYRDDIWNQMSLKERKKYETLKKKYHIYYHNLN